MDPAAERELMDNTDEHREFELHLVVSYFGKKRQGEQLRASIMRMLQEERGLDVLDLEPTELSTGTRTP